mmetsp:Transcript_52122/g.124150  ORF Transcript_52122/g.124150 Transcript_52122/m.124150 type:complete len:398 (+) Transcript_52122:93-1286(+)
MWRLVVTSFAALAAAPLCSGLKLQHREEQAQLEGAQANNAGASRGIVMSCPVNQASFSAGAWKPSILFSGFETTVRILRMLGCELPIYNILYEDELPAAESRCQGVSKEFSGVSCMGMEKQRTGYGFSKVWAVEAAPVNQVMFIDCDAFFVRDPTYLFEDGNFTKTGALFWTDIEGHYGSEGKLAAALSLIPEERHVHQDEWWFQQGYDSGLLLVDKAASQKPFQVLKALITTPREDERKVLDMISLGDKDLWHVAWLMAGPPCTADECSLMPFASMSGTCYNDGKFRMSSQVKVDRAGKVIALHQLWRLGGGFQPGTLISPSELLSINIVGRKHPAAGAWRANDLYTGIHDGGNIGCDMMKREFSAEAITPVPNMVQDLVAVVSACWHAPEVKCPL